MKCFIERIVLVGIALMLATAVPGLANNLNIITPPGSASTEGNTNIDTDAMETRFQQLFDASLFSSLPPGGGWIQSLYFRPDGLRSSGGGSRISSTQITFSTTTKDANSLSPVFADNVGPDSTIFFSASRNEALGSGSRNDVPPHGWGPALYSDGTTLDRGFFYDPARGNLLMDVLNLSLRFLPGQGMFLDAVTLPGHSTVRYQFPGGTEQGVLSSGALVVLFQIAPVPEPSVLALIALGSLLAYGLRRTR